MKKLVCLLFLFFFSIGFGQKEVKKSIPNRNISTIEIDAENCYKVEILATEGNQVIIEAQIDGEYQKDLLVSVKEKDSSVTIKTGFQPLFTSPNDKLSAHKVISIALKIKIPKDKYVSLLGTNSNVIAAGDYKNLKIVLESGFCNLVALMGNVIVTTKSGDITVENKNGNFIVNSKYGKVIKGKIPKGKPHFNLTTVTGNILLKKIK